MRIAFEWNNRRFWADVRAAVDLSFPVDFSGEQPTFFGLPRAEQEPIIEGGFVGDTDQGGGCNCRRLILCPHGNGTHTESLQHLRSDGPAPAQVIQQPLMPARVISVEITTFAESGETYSSFAEPGDRVVSRRALIEAAGDEAQPEALIIRSLPNHEAKKLANHDERWAPYFTFEAIDWLTAHGLDHLLVDLPSIDRHDDGGELPNHHRFWGALGDHATLTEMAYIPNHALDGLYLLNLQVPHLLTDAVPCRPMILPALEN